MKRLCCLATMCMAGVIGTCAYAMPIGVRVAMMGRMASHRRAATCVVALDANGGSVPIAEISVASGTAIGTLPMPTKEGVLFDGWWTDDGARMTSETVITESMTLTARWVWIPAGVTVDVGKGKAVSVPQTWMNEHHVAAAGDDGMAALTNTSANGRLSVVECYVLGLDPEDADADFRITSFPLAADGTIDLGAIKYEPEHGRWNVSGARPVVKGAANLGEAKWTTVTDDNKSSFRFFKVEVELP